jgi:2-dehydropantoate 2-reductase
MKVLVYGAGAIGSVFGGFLARMGHTVVLLGRAPHMDAIQKNGLKIEGIWGEYLIKTVETATDSAEIKKRHEHDSFDVILVTVRAYDMENAAQDIGLLTGPKTLVVSLQNGLGNIEHFKAHIPASQIIAGRVIFGAKIKQPGLVNVSVEADATLIGKASPDLPDRVVQSLAQVISKARLKCRAVSDIVPYLWAKVAYNASLSPLSGIYKKSFGELLEIDAAKASMRQVVEELYAVAAAEGVKMDPPTAQGYENLLFNELIPATAAHRSSMVEAIQTGKRTEIDAVNGEIVRLGIKNGIPTPENQKLIEAIKNGGSLNG